MINSIYFAARQGQCTFHAARDNKQVPHPCSRVCRHSFRADEPDHKKYRKDGPFRAVLTVGAAAEATTD